MKLTFTQLLKAYQQMWSNRSLTNEHNLNEENSKLLLYETIEKELRDEMTHPRVRQSPAVKFHLAVRRIMSSSLTEIEKLELIQIHLKVMENIK